MILRLLLRPETLLLLMLTGNLILSFLEILKAIKFGGGKIHIQIMIQRKAGKDIQLKKPELKSIMIFWPEILIMIISLNLFSGIREIIHYISRKYLPIQNFPKIGWPKTPVYTYSSDGEMEPRFGLDAYPVWRARIEHEGLAKADIDSGGLIDIIAGGRGNGRFKENIVDGSNSFSRAGHRSTH